MFGLGIKLRINLLQEGVGGFARLDVRAVVDKLADRILDASSAMPPK